MKRIINKVKSDRALRKSISFRILATIGTFCVTFLFTGNPLTGVGIATAQAITNSTIYYYHEKAWESQKEIVETKQIKELSLEEELELLGTGR